MEQKKAVEFTREDTKVIKAVAVMLMLIHHLFGFPERLQEGVAFISLYTWGQTPIETLVGWFGNICIPMFAFLGGYGTYLSCRNKNPQEQAGILSRKIVGLYKQYWIVFIVFIPLCILRNVSRVTPDVTSVIWNFTGLRTEFNGEWWFFTPYVLILLFYPIIQRIGKRFSSFPAELLLIVLCNTLIAYALEPLPYYSWMVALPDSLCYQLFLKVCRLLPEFLMGCFFAKYGILSALKERFSGNAVYCIGAMIILVLSIRVRSASGEQYDYLMVPLLVACIIVALNHKWGKWIRRILVFIGEESTFLWLTHSMFCYHLCQELVFAPKYSILIVAWLLVMCLVTAKLLRLLMKGIGFGWNKAKPLLAIQPLED